MRRGAHFTAPLKGSLKEMSNNLASILAAIKSAPRDIRQMILFDADKAIKDHKEATEEIRSGKYKVPSAADEYRIK